MPTYISSRQWGTRKKQLELPLIPGYVFCRFDADNRLPILNSSGVVRIVGIGKVPAAVEHAEIENLQRLQATNLHREPHPYPAVGEEVTVCAGPLAGVTGLFLKANRLNRLLLSVKLLHRSVAVEVDQTWVTPRTTSAQVQMPHLFVTACQDGGAHC